MSQETPKTKSIEELETEIKSLTDRAKTLEEKEKDFEKKREELLNHVVVGNKSNSSEAKTLAYFGVSNVKDLLGVNTGHPRFDGVPSDIKSMARQLKEDVDVARWTAQIYCGDSRDQFMAEKDLIANCPNVLNTRFGREVLAPKLKAFSSSVAADGGNWIQSIVADTYVEEFELDHALERQFTNMPMPSSPWDLPTQGGVTKARVQAENATQTDSKYSTAKVTFSAVKLAEYHILPEELNEDSAPAFMPIARKNVLDAQKRAVEAALISGDTTATHMDNDLEAAGADIAETAWKGLRKLGIDNTANGGTYDFSGSISDAKMLAMRAKGGKFFVNPRTALWIVGPKVYTLMLGLDNVTTVEKYGSGATVVSGQLTSYSGIGVYVSGEFKENLAATGVNTMAGPNTFGGILLVNKERFFRGIRRPIRIRVVADLPSHDRWLLQSTSRSDFKGVAQSASEVSVTYGFNIAV